MTALHSEPAGMANRIKLAIAATLFSCLLVVMVKHRTSNLNTIQSGSPSGIPACFTLDWILHNSSTSGAASPTSGVAIDTYRLRLAFGNHDGVRLTEVSPTTFQSEVLSHSTLDRSRVEWRLKMPGEMQIVPLSHKSSEVMTADHPHPQIGPVAAREIAESRWIPVLPIAAVCDEIYLRTIITKRSCDGTIHAMQRPTEALLQNEHLAAITVNRLSSPLVSTITFALKDSGIAVRREYPREYISVTPATEVEMFCGLVVDGWLVSTISAVAMMQPNVIDCIVPLPIDKAEDFAATLLYPTRGYLSVLQGSHPCEGTVSAHDVTGDADGKSRH